MAFTQVLTSAQAREVLGSTLKRFRKEGATAEPVVFGSHRKPEAVVIPGELYAALEPIIEELEIAELVRARAEGGSRPLADIAAELGLESEFLR